VTSIRDLTGNVTLQSGQPLLSGHSYNVTVAVTVPFSQTASQFQVTLNSAMKQSGSQFWYVETSGYGGYNSSSFTGGQRVVTFSQVQGKLVLATIFTVPDDFTALKVGGLTLHNLLQNYGLVTITVTGGSTVGTVSLTMSDQAIQTYLTEYSQKSTLISSGKIDPAYTTVVNSTLTQAQSLYSAGLVEQATNVLNTIDPSSFPSPPNSNLVTYLLLGVVVVAVLAVAFLLLLLRSRGRSGVNNSIASEVQKELASLEVTAAQYDKALADRLKRLRDKLGERV
jgi:hypothetical protein